MKKFQNHNLDERKEIMKNTSFKAEDIFGDNISKESISPEQKTIFENFLAKILWIIILG